ncbi:low affinity immunoglobulin gamma Fc region receptor III-like [Sorex araneus]|uniref:low affinity immunoglobulin gamma Fc region receptor III-like n=1 Tax=Sorex araneus TaxID=42254 RepID=UPI002433A6E4|nr:low affinity immunoglobulin gamma Fc region receptor III-like [Sorex araneus]
MKVLFQQQSLRVICRGCAEPAPNWLQSKALRGENKKPPRPDAPAFPAGPSCSLRTPRSRRARVSPPWRECRAAHSDSLDRPLAPPPGAGSRFPGQQHPLLPARGPHSARQVETPLQDRTQPSSALDRSAILTPPPGASGHSERPAERAGTASADDRAELPKAEVTLDPPWINVLQEDQVTLHCQGPRGQGDSDTHWLHNGSSVAAEGQHNLSFRATSEASGDYSCRTDHSRLSDPVRLAVVSDWLLVQTPALEFWEGDPIVLRCHSWRNKPLVKITFFQDGVAKGFSPGNRNFSIPRANTSHGGQYHCRGFIGRAVHSSGPVAISVRGRHPDTSGLGSLPKVHLILCLATALLLAADTGLYLSVHRDLRGRGPAGAGTLGTHDHA